MWKIFWTVFTLVFDAAHFYCLKWTKRRNEANLTVTETCMLIKPIKQSQLQGCFSDAWGFLPPILICCKLEEVFVFFRQMKMRAITEIIHHHSFNTFLSKKDMFVSNSSVPWSMLTAMRRSVRCCVVWFCCFNGAFINHAEDPLPSWFWTETQSGIEKKTKNKINILWKKHQNNPGSLITPQTQNLT